MTTTTKTKTEAKRLKTDVKTDYPEINIKVTVKPQGDFGKLRRNLGVDAFKTRLKRSLGVPALTGVSWSDIVSGTDADTLGEGDRLRRAFIGMAVKAAMTTCSPFCDAEDVGSIGVGSDIDITIVNTRGSIVVMIVEQLYEAAIGTDVPNMSTFFDINLYNKSLFVDRVYEMETDQILWSLTRLNPTAHAKFDVSETELASDMWGKLSEEARKRVADLWKTNVSGTDLYGATVRMEERLSDVMRNKDATEAQFAEYHSSVSVVRCLENEALISLGAYKHVVLSLQMGDRDVVLSDSDLACSFFDNVGFFLTSTSISKSLKYASRCTDAYARYIRANGGSMSKDTEVLHRLSSRAMKEKKDSDVRGYDTSLKHAKTLYSGSVSQMFKTGLSDPFDFFISEFRLSEHR
jgi:hypothetical protein